jgi:hypothetical protein
MGEMVSGGDFIGWKERKEWEDWTANRGKERAGDGGG